MGERSRIAMNMRRHGILVMLAVSWLGWVVMSIPDGSRRQYQSVVGADQLAADIRDGAVAAILTQTANRRVNIVYRLGDPPRAVVSGQLPEGTSIDEFLKPYNLDPAALAAVRFVSLTAPPLTKWELLEGVYLPYYGPPLLPPFLTLGVGFAAYNIVAALLPLVVPARRRVRRP